MSSIACWPFHGMAELILWLLHIFNQFCLRYKLPADKTCQVTCFSLLPLCAECRCFLHHRHGLLQPLLALQFGHLSNAARPTLLALPIYSLGLAIQALHSILIFIANSWAFLQEAMQQSAPALGGPGEASLLHKESFHSNPALNPRAWLSSPVLDCIAYLFLCLHLS